MYGRISFVAPSNAPHSAINKNVLFKITHRMAIVWLSYGYCMAIVMKTFSIKSLYNPLCTLIYAAAFTPFVYLILSFFAGEAAARGLCWLALLFVMLGWGAQSVFCRAVKEKRKPASYAMDETEKYFTPVKALPAFVIAVLLGVAAAVLINSFTDAQEYEKSVKTMLPFIVFLLTAVCSGTGSVLWFFPYTRLITIQSLLTIFVSFFINFMILFISGVFLNGSAYTPAVLYICAAFALPFSVLLLNQFFITRDYSGRVATAVNYQAQSYSLVIMGLTGVAAAAVFAVIFIALTGIFNLVWELIKIIAATAASSSAAESGENTVYDELSSSSATDLPGWTNRFVTVLFVLLLVLLAVFFFIRRIPVVAAFFKRAVEWIKRFFRWAFSHKEKEELPAATENLSYTDRITDVSGVKKRRRDSGDMTYAELITTLSGMSGDRQRILYLYVFLSDALRHRGYNIVKSDTPDEICKKVSKGERIREFDRVTLAYEKLRYGELTLSDGDSKELTERMCDIARSVCAV